MEFFLASASPRRQLLLAEMGFLFTVYPVNISENLNIHLSLENQFIDVAQRKAEAARQRLVLKTQALVLCADTMVVLGDQSLAKPEDQDHAFAMLSSLSGNTHIVYTAICLFHLSAKNELLRAESAIDRSAVEFRPLERAEILKYIQTGEPMDKAGSYGLQGLGGQFVKEIRGERDTVIGLPRKLLEKVLRKNGWWNELPRSS